MSKELGMLFLGVAIGSIIPPLPEPLAIVRPFVWLIFFIVAIYLLVRG